MSDPAETRAGAARAEGELPTYSKDYWDNVFEQIGRRRMVKAALAVLALLYASAIYAPLIANDRPYLIEAIDAGAYNSARSGLTGVTASLGSLAAEGRDAYAERQSGRDVPPYDAALDAELGALRLRLDTMRSMLSDDLHEPLLALSERADELVASAKSGPVAPERVDALKDATRDLRGRYAPRDEEGGEGVELHGRVRYPLLASISGIETFFMVLWLGVLTWPLWNRLVNRGLLRRDRARIRRARRKKLVAVLGVSAAAALVWHFLVGGATSFDLSPYKAGLTKGDVVASRVVFPPIAMGFSETHIAEPYRPPTWVAESEMDDAGYFVRGSRVPVPDPITGHMPQAQPVEVRHGEPERNSLWRHVLGTDILGRDLAVRLLYGGRVSLAVGFVSTLVLVLIGILVGSITGYFGGLTDIAGSRVIEIFQSIPAFFLILTAVAMIPERAMNPIFTIVLVIGLIRWTGVARLVRGEFLKLKEQEFVVAARALGLTPHRVIFRHVLPNAMGPVLVAAAFGVASGILTESAISFLGFGVKHPIPSWGSLLNESRAAEHWWLQVFPGLLIFLTVFCYNLVGEGIRDALDPRMKV